MSNVFPVLNSNQKASLITAIQLQHHMPMQFIIPGQEASPIEFQLNPQDIQEDIEPIEVEVPTTLGWFTFRWMIAPTQWSLGCYCGLEGLDVIDKLNKLVGQLNVKWILGNIGFSKDVKIKRIRRVYSQNNPFGCRYQIEMRENIPLVSIGAGPVTQFRVNPGLVASGLDNSIPSLGQGVAYIRVNPNWPGLGQAAQFVSQYSSVKMPKQLDRMIVLNNNLKKTTWDIRTGPVDINGNAVVRLAYDVGNAQPAS